MILCRFEISSSTHKNHVSLDMPSFLSHACMLTGQFANEMLTKCKRSISPPCQSTKKDKDPFSTKSNLLILHRFIELAKANADNKLKEVPIRHIRRILRLAVISVVEWQTPHICRYNGYSTTSARSENNEIECDKHSKVSPKSTRLFPQARYCKSTWLESGS